MKPTADNVKLILDRFFANIKLMMTGNNIPDGRDNQVTVNKDNPGLIIVSCSAEAQFVEDTESEVTGYIETLKHYPGDHETPPETVESYYRAYETAEAAARDLIDFWIDDYWVWAMEGIEEEAKDWKEAESLDEPESSQADGRG
jgi:hypothetical protein